MNIASSVFLRRLCLAMLGLAATPPAFAAASGSGAAQACSYVDSSGEWSRHDDCARPDATGAHIDQRHLRQLHFDADGLATVATGGQYYYIRRNGKSLAVITYDNGADPFAEGLTRAMVDGKVGYFDTDFRQAIATTYDWAWPFENGIAQVCDGCHLGERDSEGHVPLVGGRWFHIDRQGNEIVSNP